MFIKTFLIFFYKKNSSSCYIPIDSDHRAKMGVHASVLLSKIVRMPTENGGI